MSKTQHFFGVGTIHEKNEGISRGRKKRDRSACMQSAIFPPFFPFFFSGNSRLGYPEAVTASDLWLSMLFFPRFFW
jgi:hypothetical protein